VTFLQDDEELHLLPKPKKQKQASVQASQLKGLDSEADGDAEDTISEFVLSDDDSDNDTDMNEDGEGRPDRDESAARHHKQGRKTSKPHISTAKGSQRGSGTGKRRPAGVHKKQKPSGKANKKHQNGKRAASRRQ
jgi:hypothetical protein